MPDYKPVSLTITAEQKAWLQLMREKGIITNWSQFVRQLIWDFRSRGKRKRGRKTIERSITITEKITEMEEQQEVENIYNDVNDQIKESELFQKDRKEIPERLS